MIGDDALLPDWLGARFPDAGLRAAHEQAALRLTAARGRRRHVLHRQEQSAGQIHAGNVALADTLRAERREADHETAGAMLALADVIDRVVSRDEARHATGAMKARLARASRNIDWLRQESDKISSRRVAGGVR
jgi:hypothetical protein